MEHCKTCVFFAPHIGDTRIGYCSVGTGGKGQISTPEGYARDDGITVPPDYGCVNHQPKPKPLTFGRLAHGTCFKTLVRDGFAMMKVAGEQVGTSIAIKLCDGGRFYPPNDTPVKPLDRDTVFK